MKIHEAVAATYAVVGQPMSDLQLLMISEELTHYPEADVLVALRRCRTELRKIALADILDRLPGSHPGAEEAWGLVAPSLKNEGLTLVWTDEMRMAYGAACRLSDDPVAARMAFKEAYTAQIRLARDARRPPTWGVSLGHDAGSRAEVIRAAVQDGRLSLAYAERLAPAALEGPVHPQVAALTGGA